METVYYQFDFLVLHTRYRNMKNKEILQFQATPGVQIKQVKTNKYLFLCIFTKFAG